MFCHYNVHVHVVMMLFLVDLGVLPASVGQSGLMMPPPSSGFQSATHMKTSRQSANDLHAPHYQQMDKREMFHPNSSHSPSRDLSQTPQPQGHPPYPQPGLHQPGFYQQDRYQVQSQSPIPGQNQAPPPQVQAPPPQNYPYLYYTHQNHSGGYQPSNANYHGLYSHSHNNTNSYQYMGARLPPDLPPDADHQNSITQR